MHTCPTPYVLLPPRCQQERLVVNPLNQRSRLVPCGSPRCSRECFNKHARREFLILRTSFTIRPPEFTLGLHPIHGITPDDFLDTTYRLVRAFSRRHIEWWMCTEFHGCRIHVHLLLHNVRDLSLIRSILKRRNYRSAIAEDYNLQPVINPMKCARYFSKYLRCSDKKVGPPGSWGRRRIYRRSKRFLYASVEQVWSDALYSIYGNEAIPPSPRRRRTSRSTPRQRADRSGPHPTATTDANIDQLVAEITALLTELAALVTPGMLGVYDGTSGPCLARESSNPVLVGNEFYNGLTDSWSRPEWHGVVFVRSGTCFLEVSEYTRDLDHDSCSFVAQTTVNQILSDLPLETLMALHRFVREVRDDLARSHTSGDDSVAA